MTARGEAGLPQMLGAALHPGLHRVGYVSLTTGNVLDMYKAIAWELGLPTERSRATAWRAIREEITRLLGEAKQLPVLIIDEAQHRGSRPPRPPIVTRPRFTELAQPGDACAD